MTAVIKELGVVLVLATNGEVPCVVNIISLEVTLGVVGRLGTSYMVEAMEAATRKVGRGLDGSSGDKSKSGERSEHRGREVMNGGSGNVCDDNKVVE